MLFRLKMKSSVYMPIAEENQQIKVLSKTPDFERKHNDLEEAQQVNVLSKIPEFERIHNDLEEALRRYCPDDYDSLSRKVSKLLNSTKFFGKTTDIMLGIKPLIIAIISQCLSQIVQNVKVLQMFDQLFGKSPSQKIQHLKTSSNLDYNQSEMKKTKEFFHKHEKNIGFIKNNYCP